MKTTLTSSKKRKHERKGFDCGKFILSFIPLLAISLIVLSLVSYFVSFRYDIIQKRWMGGMFWDFIHTSFVSYIGIMLLWNYVQTCFTSPGFVLVTGSSSTTTTTTTMNLNVTTNTTSCNDNDALLDRGGIACCSNPSLDVTAENRRVELYGENNNNFNQEEGTNNSSNNNINNRGRSNNNKKNVLTIDFTFCDKCNIWRPPRCHHCSACQRCVLQMDHYCPWMNNCIGYNNIRHFFVTLTYLVLGCWYGVLLLLVPFYEIITKDIKNKVITWTSFTNYDFFVKQFAGRFMTSMIQHHTSSYSRSYKEDNNDDGDNGNIVNAFLGHQQRQLINYANYIRLLQSSAEERSKVWIYIIFLLLLVVGMLLLSFWYQHWKQLCSALTTIEYTARVKTKIHKKNSNPFSQGNWRKNAYQILGPNILQTFFVPFLRQKILPPFVPSKKIF